MESPVNDIKNLIVANKIKIDGSPLNGTYGVSSIVVSHEIYKVSYAEVVLVGDGIDKGTFPIADSEVFVTGAKIEILAGIGVDKEEHIFSGIIVKVGLDITSTSVVQFKVIAKHPAVKMTYSRKDSEFASKSDSAIITGILEKYSGFSSSVEATTPVHENIFQVHATDWDFIISRAEFLGYIVTLDGSNIYIGKPKLSSSPVLKVAMGESIFEFHGELVSEQQVPSLSAHAWDIKKQSLITVKASEPSVNSQGNHSAKEMSKKLGLKASDLTTSTPMAQEELTEWANSRLLRLRLGGFRGKIKIFGSNVVKTGDLIELEGVGKKFNGKAFVSGVLQELESGDWATTIKFGLDNKYLHEQFDFNNPQANGALPAISGLQVGIVKKIFGDPLSQFRILVTIPTKSESQTGFWARMCNPYATSGAGNFFLPEVGDEVIIGFLDSDPRYPIILGSVYSSAHKSPVSAADNKNNLKSITTRSKMKLSFDEEKKVIKIETPGGNSITLDDDSKGIQIKDQNNNILKMSVSGIELTSDKDVTINGMNVNINGKAKISASAKADVSVEGLNVALKAKVGLSAKGTAQAELSASGQTVVKGAMVMIN